MGRRIRITAHRTGLWLAGIILMAGLAWFAIEGWNRFAKPAADVVVHGSFCLTRPPASTPAVDARAAKTENAKPVNAD